MSCGGAAQRQAAAVVVERPARRGEAHQGGRPRGPGRSSVVGDGGFAGSRSAAGACLQAGRGDRDPAPTRGRVIDEVRAVTGWQPYTVRGVFSGALKKKLGLAVVATKEERGRVYRIADSADA